MGGKSAAKYNYQPIIGRPSLLSLQLLLQLFFLQLLLQLQLIFLQLFFLQLLLQLQLFLLQLFSCNCYYYCKYILDNSIENDIFIAQH
jgi:hypothetical protein